MTLPVVFTANGPSGYNLTNSLRFRSSASAYLNRTQGTSTNQNIGTWSLWFKRGALGSTQRLLEGYTASSDTGSGGLEFGSDNKLYFFGWTTNWRVTTQVFRDPSAWYHIVLAVDTTQSTANNRVRLYVNGSEITAFDTSNNPTQNNTFGLNNNSAVLQIGRRRLVSNNDNFFDGYMAEVNFIDGQALTPSSFGETSATTGVWIPKKYTGTYGTNGFYLPFTDNSALTTSSNVGLGKDFSGNANYWTTNNISITSGATYDSMTDVPTLTSATAANYCVLNPLNITSPSTIFGGNLNFDTGSTGGGGVNANWQFPTSGKYYFELSNLVQATTASSRARCGNTQWDNNGTVYVDGSVVTTTSTYTDGDVLAWAVDCTALTVALYKNNSLVYTINSNTNLFNSPVFGFSDGSGSLAVSGSINFGQRPFTYTPPTGFVRLNTFNLPTPTIGATASTTANKYMDASLYTGNSGTQSITNSGSMQPDFVWIKNRTGANNNILTDSVRGTSKILISDSTTAELTNANVLTAFNSNGFSLGYDSSAIVNASANNYVGWQWRASNATAVTNTAGSITSTVSASTTAGFSIVTYTGNGTSGNPGVSVGHGLGVKPSMVIGKRRNSTSDWYVWHSNLSNPVYYLKLNTTSAEFTGGTTVSPFGVGGAGFDSTVFYVSNNSDSLNVSTDTYVAYCFAQIAGYSAFGSYTGNASTDGPFIFTGFRPRFILTKGASTTGSWWLYDTARSTYNEMTDLLRPDLANADTTQGFCDALSNGFKIRNSGNNNSGATYIYMAFAETPLKFSNAR